MLSDKYKTAAEFLGPSSYATMYSQRLAPGNTESSRAASSLANLAGPYMQNLVGNKSLQAAQSLGQFNQSGYRDKPANVGTPMSNKRTARLLAQAKKQGQANNPRITIRELESIITKTGGSDSFLKQTSGMESLRRDLGPLAKKKFDELKTAYTNKYRKTGDDTPQAPAGTTPTVPGQPRSTLPSTEAPATTTENASEETVENKTEPDEFLNNFIKVSPVFKNIGNPKVRVGGMSVGNIQMIR